MNQSTIEMIKIYSLALVVVCLLVVLWAFLLICYIAHVLTNNEDDILYDYYMMCFQGHMFSFVMYAYSYNNFQRQLLFLDRMHKKDDLNHATQNLMNSSCKAKAFYRIEYFFEFIEQNKGIIFLKRV